MPEATTSLHFASLTAASAAVHDGRPPLGDGVAGRARAIDAGGHRWVLRPTGPLFWSYLFYRLRGRAMRLPGRAGRLHPGAEVS